jgi:hypothetical protein
MAPRDKLFDRELENILLELELNHLKEILLKDFEPLVEWLIKRIKKWHG